MREALIGISPEAFVSAFPFHVVFDRGFRVLQVGPSLRRVCPAIEPGACASAVLRIESARQCLDVGQPLDRPLLEGAIRQSDLLLVHYADPERLAAA